jgi:hypothetical protein
VIFSAAAISGCAGLASTTNNATPQAAVQISPSSMTFAEVSVGQQTTQTAVITNRGNSPVSITQLSTSSPEFTTSGLAFPLNLAPGQSAAFRVAFRTTTAGSVSGTLSAMTTRGSGSKVHLNGGSNKTSSQLSLSSSSLKYGNVLVNGSATQAVTLKNSGSTDINISQLTVSGAGFSVTGVTVPATIPAGQSASLQATFAPTTAGTVNGSVTITSDAATTGSVVALSGTGVSASYTMSLTPGSVSFGNVNVGGNASQTVQLTNTGNSSVTVSSVTATGSGLSVSGISGSLTINPSQTVPVTVNYAPTAAGPTAGNITVTNNDGVNAVAAVTGSGIQAALSVSPSALSFGNVNTSSTATQALQLKNTGTANLTISGASINGNGFTASGMSFPATLTPGQSGALNIQYAPTATGAASGSISLVSSAPNSPAVVALTGSGVNTPTYTMTLSPSTVAFGNVNTGSTAAQTVTLTNTGNSSVTISQVSASGAGVSVSGLSAGATVAPSQSVALSVTYSPTAAGAITGGGISVTNSQGISVSSGVSGAGVQAGITITPVSANFGSVVTGNTNSQTIQISNNGSANLTLSMATVSGSGFSLNGLSLPLTLMPSQSTSFNVQFAPTGAGAASGSVSVTSNASGTPSVIGLSGTGVAATNTLSVTPTSLNFGSVTDGSTASQSFTVTNTGNSSVAISGMTVSGTGYSILSGNGAVTLSPSQSVTANVQFAPTAAGAASGSVKVASNASGSPAAVSLSGTGTAPVSHSVALSWGASSTSVAGYNVYRSTVSGSSYVKLNGSLVSSLNYSDSSVASGSTYYYVATAVDSIGNESVYSNEVSSTVP